MTNFEWPSSILIGHAEIDEQHKRLLLLADAAVESLINSAEHKPGAAQLQALIDFAQVHFAFEERLMRSAGYPEEKQHAKSHVSVLNEIKKYCFNLGRGQDTIPVGLTSFSWFIQHIDEADRELVAWLKSQEPDCRGRLGP